MADGAAVARCHPHQNVPALVTPRSMARQSLRSPEPQIRASPFPLSSIAYSQTVITSATPAFGVIGFALNTDQIDPMAEVEFDAWSSSFPNSLSRSLRFERDDELGRAPTFPEIGATLSLARAL